jgi:parvulin-like peptidyl-prolyl isomerase
MRRQRPPTAEELSNLIEEHIRDEVLYREALALGLDRDDSVIRNRLRQKYEFLTQDLAIDPEPDDEMIAAYYDANSERYQIAPRFSFNQVFFNLDRRGAAGERQARLALAGLRDGSTDAAALGDGQMLADIYRDTTLREIEAQFGRDFAAALSELDPGVWSGPIASGYGLHLVRLDARSTDEVRPLAEVEERVRSDWAHEQREAANEAIFQQLRTRYQVVVEAGEPGAGAAVSRQPRP